MNEGCYEAEVLEFFLAFGQWLHLGKTENMLTLEILWICFVLFLSLEKIKCFILKRLVGDNGPIVH